MHGTNMKIVRMFESCMWGYDVFKILSGHWINQHWSLISISISNSCLRLYLKARVVSRMLCSYARTHTSISLGFHGYSYLHIPTSILPSFVFLSLSLSLSLSLPSFPLLFVPPPHRTFLQMICFFGLIPRPILFAFHFYLSSFRLPFNFPWQFLMLVYFELYSSNSKSDPFFLVLLCRILF